MEYNELCNRIDFLSDKCDEIISDIDKWWFTQENLSKPGINFESYELTKKEKCGEYLKELKNLLKTKRMTKNPEFYPIPTYGDRMTLKDFIENCKSGGFIDYDGFGNYVSGDMMTDIEIYPSDIKSNSIRYEFSEIIWFNR